MTFRAPDGPPIVLPTANVPVASVPIRFPWRTLPCVPGPFRETPMVLAAIVLPAPGAGPPIVLKGARGPRRTPASPLPRGARPRASVPILDRLDPQGEPPAAGTEALLRHGYHPRGAGTHGPQWQLYGIIKLGEESWAIGMHSN